MKKVFVQILEIYLCIRITLSQIEKLCLVNMLENNIIFYTQINKNMSECLMHNTLAVFSFIMDARP